MKSVSDRVYMYTSKLVHFLSCVLNKHHLLHGSVISGRNINAYRGIKVKIYVCLSNAQREGSQGKRVTKGK